MTTVLVITLIVALILLRMSIGVAMAVGGSLGILLVADLDTMRGIIATTPYRMSASWILTALPLFVLMAQFITSSGLSKRLFATAHRWLSWLPGSLAVATVASTAVFGAVSGSSTAAAATMAKTAIPEMEQHGYDRKLSLGTVSAAGTLAIMIPPSVVLIIYGVLTETSVGSLFAAAVIPGILSALAYIVVIVVWARLKLESAPKYGSATARREELQAGESQTGSGAAAAISTSAEMKVADTEDGASWLLSLRDVVLVLALFGLVMGGIYSGVVTVTEAAALGAAGALIIAIVAREMDVERFVAGLANTVRTTAMIFTVIIGAQLLGYFFSLTQLTTDLLAVLQNTALAPWAVMGILIVIYLLLGAVMDEMAILILTIPLSFPIAVELGYDPVWFGIILAKTTAIGLATPPLGLNVFITSGVSKLPLAAGFRGAALFVGVDIALVGLLLAFPGIALLLV